MIARPSGAVTPTPVRVRITYCAECGYDIQALELAGTLLRRFGHDLASVELIPWYEGSFDVTVGGALVHSMYRDGGFPEPETVAAAVKEKLSGHQG